MEQAAGIQPFGIRAPLGLGLLPYDFLTCFVMGSFFPEASDTFTQILKGDFAAYTAPEMMTWLIDSFISLISETWAMHHPGPTH